METFGLLNMTVCGSGSSWAVDKPDRRSDAMATCGYLSTKIYSALTASPEVEDDASMAEVTYPIEQEIYKARLGAKITAAKI